MERLIDNEYVVYDANILIYYCFLYKQFKIMEYTTKSRELTNYLVNQGIKILVPDFIIDEIKVKGIPNIVNNYVNDGNANSIIGLNFNPTPIFIFQLIKKVEHNFYNLLNKNYIYIESYNSDSNSFNVAVKNFADLNLLFLCY